jgi:hypothetical protein
MQNTQVFSLQVLYHDLQDKQTLASALASLSALDDTVGQVFLKISNRVKEVKGSLSVLDPYFQTQKTKDKRQRQKTKTKTKDKRQETKDKRQKIKTKD